MNRRVMLSAIVPVLLVMHEGTAGAQSAERCDFVFTNTPATRVNVVRLPSGSFQTFLGAGVVAHCAGQNNEVVADSAEYHENAGQLLLIGNVRYREPRATVTAARMTYFQGEERLNAQGNVVATFTNGTVMRGPVADYYRISRFRARESLVATGRPQLTLVEQDAAGRAGEPAIVNADRILMDGDSLVYASGAVEMTRSNVVAVGDSAFVDSGRELVRLMKRPRVTGRGDRAFTLEGDVIDLFSRNRQLERVVATPNGHATSQDLQLFADSIDLRISEERLNRAMAWGGSRARAVSTERELLADSIDVVMPGQRLEELRAIGGAYATSIPDTARVISAERDWLQGDTIVVEFEAVAGPAGGDPRTRARQLTATLNARSFHQMQGRSGIREQPSVNYVRGDRILVELREGEIEMVTVVGDASGMYLERATDAADTRSPPVTAPAGRQSPDAARPPLRRP